MIQGLPSSAQLRRLAGGMVLLTVGQCLLAQGHVFVMAQRPLDWVHWFLLLGAVIVMWRLTEIPVGLAEDDWGALATAAGVAAFIGMSVIDFALWALPTEAARQAFSGQVLQAPAISLALHISWAVPSVSGSRRDGRSNGLSQCAGVRGWYSAASYWWALAQFGNARWLVVVGHLIILAGLGAMWLGYIRERSSDCPNQCRAEQSVMRDLSNQLGRRQFPACRRGGGGAAVYGPGDRCRPRPVDRYQDEQRAFSF